MNMPSPQAIPRHPTDANGIGVRLVLSAFWTRTLAVLLAVLGALLVQGLAPNWLSQWSERITSYTWSVSDSAIQEKRIVVVDIDEKSVQALGPWPWPRERAAQLLQTLDQHDVGLKVVDILFDGVQPKDSALVSALGAGAPTVVAQLFSLNPEPHVATGTLSGALPMACPPQATLAFGHMSSAAAIAQASPYVGHISPVVDADGTVRRIPALVCYQGKTYPALTVAALSAATGASPQWKTDHALFGAPAHIEVGGFDLPVNAQGQLMVSYQMPRSGFISVSASDVLTGQVPEQLLKGAWVLVGSTAMGAGDAVPTPQGGAVGGIEVHAQILAAALDARTPYAPNWAPLWPWAAAALSIGIALLLLQFGRFGAAVTIPLAALVNLGWMGGLHVILLLQQQQVLSLGLPLIFAGLLSGLLLVAETLRVRLERERLYGNLSSYLPEGAARKIAFSAPSAQVLAERHDATVMFVDLRNFSAYCEGRSPEDAATVLHNFYTTLDSIVTAHGGAVEQMVGDGIMAVWNGSTPCEDHAQKALTASIKIWEGVTAKLPQVASRKTPPLDLGLGIETGEVMVGSFGPAHRRVYTVLGETVSVAARLEALTSELAYPILLGPELYLRTQEPKAKALGDFLLSGMTIPRKIYTLPVQYSANHLQLVYSCDADQAFAG